LRSKARNEVERRGEREVRERRGQPWLEGDIFGTLVKSDRRVRGLDLSPLPSRGLASPSLLVTAFPIHPPPHHTQFTIICHSELHIAFLRLTWWTGSSDCSILHSDPLNRIVSGLGKILNIRRCFSNSLTGGRRANQMLRT
jgi:hypothetical protein